MGLIVDIYRHDYNSPLNVFRDVRRVTVINVDGPFDPQPDRPAAILTRRPPFNNPVVIPVGEDGQAVAFSEVAFGGAYAGSSDSRWSEAVPFYGAVPIHDYAINLDGQDRGYVIVAIAGIPIDPVSFEAPGGATDAQLEAAAVEALIEGPLR